jgi:hypothetical protein
MEYGVLMSPPQTLARRFILVNSGNGGARFKKAFRRARPARP